MKRKGVGDQVSQDFSDFPLSYPATKIRRLDAELPLIVEEDEAQVPPPVYEADESMPEIEESPSPASDNEERAIILYKPLRSPSFVSPSNFSVTVNSDIISGFKSKLASSRQSDGIKWGEEEARCSDKNNDDLAVVPWVPSQFPGAAAELMGGEASMDVEEESSNSTLGVGAESVRQWQQQHCLIPQLPRNTSTPITWTTSGD